MHRGKQMAFHGGEQVPDYRLVAVQSQITLDPKIFATVTVAYCDMQTSSTGHKDSLM